MGWVGLVNETSTYTSAVKSSIRYFGCCDELLGSMAGRSEAGSRS